MPRKTPLDELETILSAVMRMPDGASMEAIAATVTPALPLPLRTLQRRLTHLVQDGKLLAVGNRRGRLYQLPPMDIPVPSAAGGGEARIPLSSAAAALHAVVTRPIQLRHPVAYNREFLDAYRPNHSEYLPLSLRKHLLELGTPSDANRPAGTYARQLFQRLLIDLSWNSSRLEGNTYSLLETMRLLEANASAESKSSKEARMILNHKAAIEFLVDSEVLTITRYTLFNLHALLAGDLLPDAACGQLRSIPVGIGKSVYRPPEIPQLINECFTQIVDTANAICDPFEQAFFLMVHLPYLQPFEDVNKRVSRLAVNIPFIRNNLCPLSFIDVPEETYITGVLAVYELNRIELLRDLFVWAYERSCREYGVTCRTLGDPDPFAVRHSALIVDAVTTAVRDKMDKLRAIAFIRQRACEDFTASEQDRFVEIVERRLMDLHEGNIARYKIRPSEYQQWHEGWRTA